MVLGGRLLAVWMLAASTGRARLDIKAGSPSPTPEVIADAVVDGGIASRMQGVVLAGSGPVRGASGLVPCEECNGSLRTYNLESSGNLSTTWFNSTMEEDSNPFWMVYGKTPSQTYQCVWVLYNEISRIESYQYGSGTGLRKQSTLERNETFSLKGPIHGSLSSDGRALVVSYGEPPQSCDSTDAGVASFEVLEDCSLALRDAAPHNGSSILERFQCEAHPHGCTSWQDFMFCCDRGMDRIFTYRLERNFRLAEVARTAVRAGLGPRHAATHPTLPLLYVITEMGCRLLIFDIDAKGELTLAADVSTTASPYPESMAADVLLSPDGEFLYASNRGFADGANSTIAVFKVSEDGRSVSNVQVAVLPKPALPQSFALTTLAEHCGEDGVCRPDVGALLVPSMNSGAISSFLLGADGRLSELVGSVVGPFNAQSIVVLPCTDGESC